MNVKLSSNVYDKLFDFRKVNQIRSCDGGFYDNIASPIASNVNLVQHVRIAKHPPMSSLGLGCNETDNLYFTSSSSSNYSSFQKYTTLDYGSTKFNTLGSKVNKKSKLNRSKSLVLKKKRNLNILKKNYIDSNEINNYNTQIYNRLNQNLNKPKIYPRSIYLNYEKSSNNFSASSSENSTDIIESDEISKFLNFRDINETMNDSIPDNCLNSSSGSNGKNQLKTLVNKKLFKNGNTDQNNLDDSRMSILRNRLLCDLIKPIKKSFSSASSKSSSFSSSLSCSSSSSSPSSPINSGRKSKLASGTYQIATKDYESIYEDDLDQKYSCKGKVVDELIQTEMDFYRVMKLLYDIYLGPKSDSSVSSEIKDAIFCNMKDIVDLSSTLLNDFELNILNKRSEEVKVGKCFLKNCEKIRVIYSNYAQSIEYSNNILEKNENSTVNFIENGLKIVRQQINTLDLQSLLLKPIQRVLKYPLLIQELIKNTESYHTDYLDLLEALKSMQDVATYINEIKRRHELIVKYGRKIKENSTISNKMSKLTMHSMIKKSNRISIKLSNALRINTVRTVDMTFDDFETRFHSVEKMIKTFIKDATHLISSLKEFLKTQMANSESLHEYFSDDKNEEIDQYVHLNSLFLNDFITKKTILIHEKVLKPLKNLLECLAIPNKLIIKRRDKLLDYEFAKINFEKSKDKFSFKSNQENLNESKKNFEALNNQLIEELPGLVQRCTVVFDKCYQIFVLTQKNIYQNIHLEINKLISKHFNVNVFLNDPNSCYTSLCTQLNNRLQIFVNNNLSQLNIVTSNRNLDYSDLAKVQNSSNSAGLDIMHKFFSTKSEPTKRIKNIFSFQRLKNFANQDKQDISKISSVKPNCQPKLPTGYNSSYDITQTEEIRDRLKRIYSNNLYIVNEKYCGLGLSDNLNLDIHDLVYVMKHSDPCGNPDHWFVDNGISKGIVPAKILKPFRPNSSDQLVDLSQEQDYNYNHLEFDGNSLNSKNPSNNLSEAIDNSNDEDSFRSDDTEYCVALYPFDSDLESTLSVIEGEKLRVVEKHDSNMNNEWWLVQKIDQNEPIRGYVPANYVELIKN